MSMKSAFTKLLSLGIVFLWVLSSPLASSSFELFPPLVSSSFQFYPLLWFPLPFSCILSSANVFLWDLSRTRECELLFLSFESWLCVLFSLTSLKVRGREWLECNILVMSLTWIPLLILFPPVSCLLFLLQSKAFNASVSQSGSSESPSMSLQKESSQ